MADDTTSGDGRHHRRVIAFGVFDILHPGHVAFLEAARTHGDELIVVVTPDMKAEREKGRRPHFRLEERMRMVGALAAVDRVEAGDIGTRWTVVERLRPDVICIGYDQNPAHPLFLVQLKDLERKPEIVRISAHEPERYGTSKIRSTMRR